MGRLSVITALLLALLPAAAAIADPPPPADVAPGSVAIAADRLSHDQQQDLYRAEGDVTVRWNGATLYADLATLDQGRGEATADGRVRLVRGGDVLTGDRLRLQVASQQGEVENAGLFLQKPNFHLQGSRLAKTGPDDYRLDHGSFTTCDGPSPSWSFSADDLEVTLEEFATGRNAVFALKGVPVFYLPYVVFPVKRERQSGFLFPRLGSSSKKGAYLDIPFYWAISPTRDVTFDLDLQSRRGVGGGLEYRYLGPRESGGELRTYYIYDSQLERSRGDLSLRLQENFTPDTFARSQLNLALDRDYYRDFGVASGDYNRQYLESTASLTHHWQRALLAGELRWLEDLDAADNRATLQRLPALTFLSLGERLGSLPLELGGEAAFSHFHRDRGVTGQRLSLSPRLTSTLPLGQGFTATAWGGYQQRFYHADPPDGGAGWRSAGLAEAGLAVSGALVRIYGIPGEPATKLRHLLLPELRYEFVEQHSQDSLPFFDFDDRPLGRNLVVASLASYLAMKRGTEPARDLAYLRLSQGYQLSGSRRDLLTMVDDLRPFTDLRLEGRLTPAPWLSLTGDSRFSPYRGDFNTAAVAMQLDDERGNRAGLAYRWARDQVEYLEGKLATELLRPFIASYAGRYSFDRGAFLESLYSVEYRHQCWSVNFSFRDRTGNREFMVNFTLAGIGAIGPLKAF
jgi:LPS-assembly protein